MPTAPLSLPTRDSLRGLREPFFGAAEFVEHQRELQPESDRLRVNAVAPADHRRHFETPRLVRDDLAQLLQVLREKILPAAVDLHRQCRVENIR